MRWQGPRQPRPPPPKPTRAESTDGSPRKGGRSSKALCAGGGQEEALWSNYFNGAKNQNVWAAWVPKDQRPSERLSFTFFGLALPGWKVPLSLDRPFMARFGDIERIWARGRDLRVTMTSGTEFELDRYGADDLADGLTINDPISGTVELGEWKIQSIEFLAAPQSRARPDALYGTVRTANGEFTGLIQWDRELTLLSDRLMGHAEDGEVAIALGDIRSIVRRNAESAEVTLKDGNAVVLSGNRHVGERNRGVYVDDLRYGRVLVPWASLERLDFGPAVTGRPRSDFSAGHPLTGSVVTRAGDRIVGRIVFDLDESETTETLDAPRDGVHYNIPFGSIEAIRLPSSDRGELELAEIALTSGESIELELAGDLYWTNAGILVFGPDDSDPTYLPWAEVGRIEFDRPDPGS